MSASTVFASGFALGASLIIAIGAQNAFVLRQGLLRQHVGAVVFTCILVDVSLMTVGVSGMAASLQSHPQLLRAVGWIGAAFLAWYGLAAVRRAFAPQSLHAAADTAALALGPVLTQTLAVSLLNPHVYLDTVLLVGSVGAQQPPPLRPSFLAGAALASTVWFGLLGFGARVLAPLFARPVAWRVLDGVVALTLWVCAAALAIGVDNTVHE
jgi:L-lysine exporter family protein LysE/ArgO